MYTERELNYRLYLQREENFARADVKQEFERYNAIKTGDVDKVKENCIQIKKSYHSGKGTLSTDPIRSTMYHFAISAGIIARVCLDAGLPHDEAYTLSDIYIQKADKLNNCEEIIDLLCQMQMDYASRMKRFNKIKANSIHIRNAIDYIYEHVHEHLTMAKLASNEGLNPDYFSRLFYAETGQTTKQFILRAKIRTAENILIYSNDSISEIALSLGFSSQSAFTSAFKKLVGTTPNAFRNNKSYMQLFN